MINEEMIEKVYHLVLEGNYADVAAQCLNIDEGTYYNYMKRARRELDEGLTDTLFIKFFQAIKKAEAEAEQKFLETIKKASITTWQAAAWYLERKHRAKWATRTEIAHSGEVSVTIVDDVEGEDEE